MTRFFDTVDAACDARAAELGRALNWDEVRLLEDTLFMAWLQAQRYDELIDHALDEYELQDGAAFCASLSERLAKAGDRARCERLFAGLTKTREAAFRRVWSMAQDGHIGAMKEAARHLANALEAQAGLYHCYWVMQDEAGMDAVKQEMLRLQDRRMKTRQARR
jgi:hypothetical protein